MLPIGSLHIVEAMEKFWFDPSFALRNSQSEILLYGTVSPISSCLIRNIHMCLLSGKSCSFSGKLHVLATSYLIQLIRVKVSLFIGEFWPFLLIYYDYFIKVMKLSVSILEADSVHLCHLQPCFSIHRIRSIYGHNPNKSFSYTNS